MCGHVLAWRLLLVAIPILAKASDAGPGPIILETSDAGPGPIILVHGGAGTIPPSMSQGKFTGMKAAVREAWRILEVTASATDAAEAAIKVLEDDPNFNAGRGSKLTIFGHIEMDASIMVGDKMEAGGVASVTGLRHPIEAARAVMDNSSHVLLVGEGARRFAVKTGIEQVEEQWLVTNYSRYLLEEYLAQHNISHLDKEGRFNYVTRLGGATGSGTVGVVVWDGEHLAAATSTGGITGKLPGRVGDSPTVGHGVFADDYTAAVSCTGTGETFMRTGVARRVGWKVEEGLDAQEAAQEALDYMKQRVGGEGGAIVIDKLGQIGIAWNSQQMAWAYGKQEKLHYGINRGDDFEEDLCLNCV